MSRPLLHFGDSLEYLKRLDDDSLDAVVTDPPYGTGEHVQVDSADQDFKTEVHKAEWDVWDTQWLEQSIRVASCVISFCAERYVDDLIRFAKESKKRWRLLAWCRPGTMPTFQGGPGYGMDPIVAIGPLQPIGGNNWWCGSSVRKGMSEWLPHPHQKPIKLMRWLVQLAAPKNGVVLDPFMGSGTTGIACLDTGRRFIGCDKTPEYFELASERLDIRQGKSSSQALTVDGVSTERRRITGGF